MSWKVFSESLMGATRLYCMIALILAGAAFLTLAMGYIGLPRKLAEFITGLGLSPLWLLFWLMVFYIVLGCFLDGISMVVLTMGVILPTIQKAGIDLIWFGIFIVLVVEMAQITPPVGFNLFVLQGMTKQDITWIARASLPLFLLMVVAVALIYFFPRHRHLAPPGTDEVDHPAPPTTRTRRCTRFSTCGRARGPTSRSRTSVIARKMMRVCAADPSAPRSPSSLTTRS